MYTRLRKVKVSYTPTCVASHNLHGLGLGRPGHCMIDAALASEAKIL